MRPETLMTTTTTGWTRKGHNTAATAKTTTKTGIKRTMMPMPLRQEDE